MTRAGYTMRRSQSIPLTAAVSFITSETTSNRGLGICSTVREFKRRSYLPEHTSRFGTHTRACRKRRAVMGDRSLGTQVVRLPRSIVSSGLWSSLWLRDTQGAHRGAAVSACPVMALLARGYGQDGTA